MTPPAQRSVRVPRERLAGWIERFSTRHGELEVRPEADVLTLQAADGAVADLAVPFLPWRFTAADPVAALTAHVGRHRTLAVLLARRGGHAAGVFTGERLVASKVGAKYVQGQTKAGGWSQQRYARRRANQAAKAGSAAADDAVGVLLPHLDRLQHLILGGDRRTVEGVLSDPRLAPVAALPREPDFRPTADPRLAVLTDLDPTSIRIDLNPLA